MVSGPDDKYFATCSDDGSLRVWTTDELEQTLQFQVMDQVCPALQWSVHVTFISVAKVRLLQYAVLFHYNF
jgi:WD40 repeat protein